MTRYEKIKLLSIEQMAQLLCSESCLSCDFYNKKKDACSSDCADCFEGHYAFLEREVKESKNEKL